MIFSRCTKALPSQKITTAFILILLLYTTTISPYCTTPNKEKQSQNPTVGQKTDITFVELNCENFFDCLHDSLKADDEFTPQGSRRWTLGKYLTKIRNICKELISCGMTEKDYILPDIIALCEVENDSVMTAVTQRSLLRNAGYQYIMTASPDVRGIDVALLYSPARFAPITSYPIRIDFGTKQRSTRDILYVSGRTVAKDTFHIFVVHAPSRYGGEKRTGPLRIKVAQRLCEAVDSLRCTNNNANIIIAGDFNDPHDAPALNMLYQKEMVNASCHAIGKNGAKGSYKYKGAWESIDHILLGGNLIQWYQECIINDTPFLLEEDLKYGGKQPMRTFKGWKYQKGYSDHLPIVLRLTKTTSM
ncbi:MAG: endonuclease/exonuclease/phosphatase family protein [Prevotella sp.]